MSYLSASKFFIILFGDQIWREKKGKKNLIII